MELAGTKAKLPDGWWMMKLEEPFKSYVVFTDSKCVAAFFANEAPLSESEADAAANDTSGKDMMSIINGKNSEYYTALGRPQSLVVLDKVNEKPFAAGFAEKGWKKASFESAEGKSWKLLYKPGADAIAYVNYLGVTGACGAEAEEKIESLFK